MSSARGNKVLLSFFREVNRFEICITQDNGYRSEMFNGIPSTTSVIDTYRCLFKG